MNRAVDAATIADLLAGRRLTLQQTLDGQIVADAAPPVALLSGSFNPLHHGHEQLHALATTHFGACEYEISVTNVDKPPLTEAMIQERLRPFVGHAPVRLTCAPTFAEKAKLFPGCAFVVGFDTAERIVMPHYYGGMEAMAAALASIRDCGGRFLVAARLTANGLGTGHAIDYGTFADLFIALDEEAFRVDVCSTELRLKLGFH